MINDVSKPWKVVIARYNAKLNGVAERRIAQFSDMLECQEFVNKHGDRAIMAYHQDAIFLHCPEWHMIKTEAYKKEYLKVKD